MQTLERLNQAVAYLKGQRIVKNQQDIVDAMDYNKSSVSQAFKGKENYLTESFLKQFNKAFGSIFNNSWLVDGIGDMLKQDSNSKGISVANSKGVAINSEGAIVSGDGGLVVNEPAEQYYSRQSELEVLRKEVKSLHETVALLKASLEDKERTIQLLMKANQ